MSEDLLNENGLSVKTASDIRDELVNNFKDIYGEDINLDSNTQDGQLIDIYTQANIDLREMIMELYNSGDPDLCRGSLQDVRYRINNLFRKAGSFTIQPITLTCNKTITLEGLDANYNDINSASYGVSDDSGNIFYLIDTIELEAGTHELLFRASVQGDIQPTIGTITNPITIIQGVTSVINDKAPEVIGRIEETDMEFALRRERSTETKAQNNADALRSQLLNLDGVTNAFVYDHDYENYPSGVDADGIPLHYIWVIVEGGASDDIGTLIYANTSGAGSKGDIAVNTLTSSGQTFTAHFDRVVGVPLYIKFDLQATEHDVVFAENTIEDLKNYISQYLTYDVNEFAETSKINDVVRDGVNALVGTGAGVNIQISLDEDEWVNYIPCPSKKDKFTIAPTQITINRKYL